MKIKHIEAIPFRLPVRRDFRWAGLEEGLGGFVLVKIHTDDGLIGYGEATPLPDWGGDFGRRGCETQRTVVTMIEEHFRLALVGLDPTEITRARTAMDKIVIGHSYAKCAIDIALYDLLGKALNAPIHTLLGGACRDGVAVAHMIGLMPESEAVDEGCGAVRDGITALQIKGGVDPERDIRVVRQLRKELGADVTLRLDANQAYRDVRRAIGIIRRLADAGVDLVEQPVEGLARMAAVKQAVDVPIVADETCWNAYDALDVIGADAADCLSIYLAKAGGISEARKVACVAELSGHRCDVNGSIESGVGTAANLHFALAMKPVELASVIPINAPSERHPNRVGGNYYQDDIITEPLPVSEGRLLPLSSPGLGIEIDEQKLKRYRC